MEEVVRQNNPRHRIGVLQLSNGQVREAFQTLQKEIHEVPLEPLEDYALKLRAQMHNPAIIVNTNAQTKLIHETIKSEIIDIAGGGLKQRIWKPVHMTKTQKMRAGNYEAGNYIRFSRDVGKTFKRGEIYKIDKVDHDQAKLCLKSKHGTKSYTPARHGSGDSFTRVYKQEVITLHEGDRIKFRENDRKLGISNNDFGVIGSIKDGAVTIGFDEGKQTTLPKGHRMLGHIDHGWVNTAYSFQGATVKNNIVIMKANHNPLTTLASLYVGSSRHNDNLAIVTDDKEKLLEIISDKLDMQNEIITYRDAPTMRDIETDKFQQPEQEQHKEEIEQSQEQDYSMGM